MILGTNCVRKPDTVLVVAIASSHIVRINVVMGLDFVRNPTDFTLYRGNVRPHRRGSIPNKANIQRYVRKQRPTRIQRPTLEQGRMQDTGALDTATIRVGQHAFHHGFAPCSSKRAGRQKRVITALCAKQVAAAVTVVFMFDHQLR